MIIVMEGIDNSGKTTISEMLYAQLIEKGKNATISKELTTFVGDIIKKSMTCDYLSPIMKAFLFAADRQLRIESLCHNKNECIYIMDRYLHSAIAYREAENLDPIWVREINKYIPKSDIAFYIDIAPEESIRRNSDKKFNIKYSVNELKKIRDSYLQYADRGEMILIDGMRELRLVFFDVIRILKERDVI